MKTIKLLLLIIGLPLCLNSCKKDSKKDFLIFGHFYGECGGEECVEIFKLQNNTLFEDTNDQYPASESSYDAKFSTEHTTEKYELVESLMQSFPESLWDEPTVIGTPDAGDWGGLYIEYCKGNQSNFWLIDQKLSNIPDQLHHFVNKVNVAIADINL